MPESTKDQTVEALGVPKNTTPVPRARPQEQQEAPPPLSARAAPVESKKEEEPVTPEKRTDVPIRPLERITRNAAYALGVEDAITKAKQLSANERQYNKHFREGRLDNDTGEDTLRHLLGGGLIYGDRDKLNVLEKLGRSVAGTYYDYREQTYLGGKSAHEENNIDLNNNEYGRLLRARYPKEGDFVKRSIQVVEALGKNPKLAESFAIKNEDGEWVAPMLSSVGQDKPKGFAEGGMSTNMNDEMSSMMQEAPKVDPVSGNEVPIGSKPEEVRDDIPARLSEGEMVIPADVVKFFGVEYFMKLRDKAKKGFARMEEMGQMGNGDAASGPDELFSESGGESEEEDLPFTLEDFDVDEEGPVEANEGLYVGDNDILSGIFGNNASFDTGTDNSNTDNTPTPDPTEAPDFDNTDADGEDFQNYFKDNPGFSQADLVGGLGEGDAGLKNYNYLVGNLFGEDSNLLNNLDIFNQVNNSTSTTGNPIDAFATLPADQQQILTGIVRGNLEKIGGDASDTQADTTVSVSELSSIPSEQNLAALQSFASIPSSIIGIADQLMGQAINPLGRASAPLGLAQRGIAEIMGISFEQINSIASVQQQQAKTAALQMAHQLANMTPAVKTELAVLAQLKSAGIDPESLTENQQAVSFADPVTGATTVGVAYGTPGKGFGHIGVPSSYMSMEVVANVNPDTISPIGPPSQEALDEISTAAEVQAAVGSTTPAEDVFGGITGYGNQDVDSMMGFGNANHGYGDLGEEEANPDGSYGSVDNVNDFGDVDAYGNPDASIDDIGLGADIGAGQESIGGSGPGGGAPGGPGDDGSGEGGGDSGGGSNDPGGDDGQPGDAYGRGGFVKRRRKKKKQYAKGGLATRR